jgi:hypothetical protein
MASVCRTIRRNMTHYKHEVVPKLTYRYTPTKKLAVTPHKPIWQRIVDWFKGVR